MTTGYNTEYTRKLTPIFNKYKNRLEYENPRARKVIADLFHDFFTLVDNYEIRKKKNKDCENIENILQEYEKEFKSQLKNKEIKRICIYEVDNDYFSQWITYIYYPKLERWDLDQESANYKSIKYRFIVDNKLKDLYKENWLFTFEEKCETLYNIAKRLIELRRIVRGVYEQIKDYKVEMCDEALKLYKNNELKSFRRKCNDIVQNYYEPFAKKNLMGDKNLINSVVHSATSLCSDCFTEYHFVLKQYVEYFRDFFRGKAEYFPIYVIRGLFKDKEWGEWMNFVYYKDRRVWEVEPHIAPRVKQKVQKNIDFMWRDKSRRDGKPMKKEELADFQIETINNMMSRMADLNHIIAKYRVGENEQT